MQSTHDAVKRSVVRQISKSPRFTAIDFYIPTSPIPGLPIRIPIRGRAIQVITSRDDNALRVPAIDGTDTEVCRCHWDGAGSVNEALVGNGVLNGAGTIATFAASVGSVSVTTTAYHSPAVLTLSAFQIAGTCQPSATAAVCNVAAGVQVNFPGGAAGVYALNLPIFTGAVAPPCPGDLTFNPGVALIPGVVFTGESTDTSECESTWSQPAGAGYPCSILGYIHLNVLSPHIYIPNATGAPINQTEQAIPVLRAVMNIRVEQEFDEVIIEPFLPAIDDVCAGILIVEHETEYDLR